ncbi:exported peptidase, partial [gut metagenome]
SASHDMGKEVEEAFDFMVDGGFYDISFSSNKAPMSFQTYLSQYEAPYLFIDPVGDIEDIITFSHEFGHFLDAYVNYNAYETVDVAEIFSQAMEYLMLFYYGGALSDEEQETLINIKIMDTLEMYVQQASFAEFESIVYSTDPELLSADFLNDLSLQLAIDYGYYDGENEEYFAKSWCDIVHFFEMPFYIITYPVSNDAAMQIFEFEMEESGKG